MNLWISVLIFLAIALLGFVLIARAGRKLRTSHPRPAVARYAFLEWEQDGERMKREITPPFYFGRSTESNIVLPQARANYEACIFYHDNRFAIQMLQQAAPLVINGEEMLAGYLNDADRLEVAGQSFIFRSYS